MSHLQSTNPYFKPRIEAALKALGRSKSPWAVSYWSDVIALLCMQLNHKSSSEYYKRFKNLYLGIK